MPSTHRPRRGRVPARIEALLGALLAMALLAVGVPSATSAAAAPPPTYRPPVDAPVSDPFRPPTSPYGQGNRGLEYDTAAGTEVRAAADGRVTFAGSVAGTRHVTVLHPDGLRTTASYLATVAVVVGQEVEQGDLLGTTEGRLHFSARAGDSYLDPAALFGGGPPQVWLVPFDLPPGLGLPGERSAIRQLLGLGSSALGLAGRAVDASGDAAGWVIDRGDELLRLAAEYGPLVVPQLRAARLVLLGIDVLGAAWEQARRSCTAAGEPVAPPTEQRVALLVAGLGSTSGNGSIDDVDVGALGYEPAEVVRFSYAGGRTPGSTGRPAGVPARRYTAADTQEDLYESARRLADLVEQVAAATPGVPIDLIAHSQGGLVARLALVELQRRGSVGSVGMLATIATPHGGADLATMARAIELTPGGREVLEAVAPLAGLDPSAPSARQLSETSDLIAELARTPLPEGLPAVSIAGRTDYVVPVPRTELAGARSVVVPIASAAAHADLPGHPGTTRELALALAGAPPACRGLVDAVLDQATGAVISEVEDRLAPLAAGLSALGGPVVSVGEGIDAALEGVAHPR